jgi:hypothetical protein
MENYYRVRRWHYKNDSIALAHSCLVRGCGTLGILGTFLDTSVLVIQDMLSGPHRNILYRELVRRIFLGPQKQSVGAQMPRAAKRVEQAPADADGHEAHHGEAADLGGTGLLSQPGGSNRRQSR